MAFLAVPEGMEGVAFNQIGSPKGISLEDLIEDLVISELAPLNISGDDPMSNDIKDLERIKRFVNSAIREIVSDITPLRNFKKIDVNTTINRIIDLPEDYQGFGSIYTEDGLELDINISSEGDRVDARNEGVERRESSGAPSVYISGHSMFIPFEYTGFLSFSYYCTHPKVEELGDMVLLDYELIRVLKSLIASMAFGNFISGGQGDRAKYFYNRYFAQIQDYKSRRDNTISFEQNKHKEGGWI